MDFSSLHRECGYSYCTGCKVPFRIPHHFWIAHRCCIHLVCISDTTILTRPNGRYKDESSMTGTWVWCVTISCTIIPYSIQLPSKNVPQSIKCCSSQLKFFTAQFTESGLHLVHSKNQLCYYKNKLLFETSIRFPWVSNGGCYKFKMGSVLAGWFWLYSGIERI